MQSLKSNFQKLFNFNLWLESAKFYLLILVVFAPALYLHAPTQDQMRAFRYGLNVKAGWELCRANTRDFYMQTGRPLVPLMECAEHFTSWNLADLTVWRWVSLVLICMFFVAVFRCFRSWTDDVEFSLLNAFAVIGIPGLQIFILQGGPALVLLFGLYLTWLGVRSFVSAGNNIDWKFVGNNPRRVFRTLVLPTLIYAPVFLIYPVLAFMGFWYFAFLALYSRTVIEFRRVVDQTAKFTCYLALLSLFYMLSTKIAIKLMYSPDRMIPLGENYSLTPNILHATRKLSRLVVQWWENGFFLFDSTHEIPIHFFVMALLLSGIWFLSRDYAKRQGPLFIYKLTFCIVATLLAQSIWLISSNALEPSRYFIHIFAIFTAFVLWVFWQFLLRLTIERRKTILQIALLFTVVVMARSVTMELVNSMVETSVVRTILYDRYKQNGMNAFSHVHFIKPDVNESYVGNGCLSSESLCTPLSQHPEHSGQMVTALLREFISPEELKTYQLKSCQEDLECVQKNRGEPRTIVVSIAKKERQDYASVQSLVIDMNNLVDRGGYAKKFWMP